MVVVWRSDHKKLTPAQYEAVAEEANFCHLTFDKQLSSPGEAIFTDAALGTVANAISVGNAAHDALGASAKAYGQYGGEAASLPNGLAGAKGWSYAMVSDVGMCAEANLRDGDKDGNPILHGVHVGYALVRTRNATNKPAPGVVENWTGPTAGSTAQTPSGS